MGSEMCIRDRDGKNIFIASDIGKVLGLKNIRQATSNFDEDEKVVIRYDSLGGIQNTIFLTKQGAFRLIMRSDKPIARPFQKWFLRVLEEIEETGRYEMQKELDELKCKYNDDMKDSIKLVTKYKDTEDARVSKILVDGCRDCLLYTSPSPRDLSTSRMPSSA